MFTPSTIRLAVAGCLIATPAIAQDEIDYHVLPSPIVVTATRVEQNRFDLPMSIDATDAGEIQEGQLKVNLSESAARVPGVVVNNRNNPAQDLAVQIRGFGARSAFGVRGVRLYADGIPMTMPDGQGQTGTFNLDTAKRVEYLRGPFSALYGNSSGGVVQIFTQDGPEDPTLSGGITLGSDDTRRANVTFGGDNDGFNYIINASAYRSDGYRDQSETHRARQARLRSRRGHQAHRGGNRAGPAGQRGSAGAEPRPAQTAPQAGQPLVAQVRHPRQPQPRADRRHPGTPVDAGRHDPPHDLLWPARQRAVPVRFDRRPAQRSFRRRGRHHRPRILGRGFALDAPGQAGRDAVPLHGRHQLRPHGR